MGADPTATDGRPHGLLGVLGLWDAPLSGLRLTVACASLPQTMNECRVNIITNFARTVLLHARRAWTIPDPRAAAAQPLSWHCWQTHPAAWCSQLLLHGHTTRAMSMLHALQIEQCRADARDECCHCLVPYVPASRAALHSVARHGMTLEQGTSHR